MGFLRNEKGHFLINMYVLVATIACLVSITTLLGYLDTKGDVSEAIYFGAKIAEKDGYISARCRTAIENQLKANNVDTTDLIITGTNTIQNYTGEIILNVSVTFELKMMGLNFLPNVSVRTIEKQVYLSSENVVR